MDSAYRESPDKATVAEVTLGTMSNHTASRENAPSVLPWFSTKSR